MATSTRGIVIGASAGGVEALKEVVSRIPDPRLRFVNLPQRGNYPDDPMLRWLVAGTTAHTVKNTWPPATSSSPQLPSTIRKPPRLGTHSLAFLSLWFSSADDMLLEKWHEPELLVDLAAPEIVDW